VSDVSAHRQLTRRQLLRAPRPTPDTDTADTPHLTALLAIEGLSEAMYQLAATAPGLSPAARRLLAMLRQQERLHAETLAAELGGVPVPELRGERAVQAALQTGGVAVTVSALHSERDWFAALEEVENVVLGAYYDALLAIRSPASAALAARILAAEAQHQTLLFSFRHPHDIALAVAEGVVQGSAQAQ